MYDEFRIRSCKCKIYPSIANTFTTTGQFQLHTAWDRNGSVQIFYPTESDGHESYGRFLENTSDIKTYSSLMTKPLLQYQAGTVQRVLAAAGVPDTLWYPTALARAFTAANWSDENNGNAWI